MYKEFVAFFDGPMFGVLFLFFFLFFFFVVGFIFFILGKVRKDEDKLYEIGGSKLMFYSILISVTILLAIVFIKSVFPPLDN
jgi:hypothetical protein